MKKFIAIGLALAVLLLAQAVALAEAPCAYFDEHGDHDWEQGDVQKPTCTTDGYYELKCKVCGVTKTETTEPAMGHDWQETGNKEESTCTQEGWTEVKCANCGEVSKMTLPLAPHKWEVKSETKSTCAVKGSKVEECSVCKQTRTTESNLLPHVYSAWTVSKQATDHSQGRRERTCTVCGNKETEYFYPDGTLMRGGKRGDEVQALQIKLVAMGFLHDVADGIFGKNTEQAVKQLQLAEGLHSDGIAWPQTLAAVDARYQRTVSSVTPAPTAAVPTGPVSAPDVTPSMGTRQNMSDGQGCVYWSEGIGFEYISCCDEHKALIEKTLHALSIEDKASRTYVLKPTLNAWNAALENEYADWMALCPDQTDLIEAARDAFRASIEAHASLFAENPEDAVKWRLFSTMLETARLCAQLRELAVPAEVFG